MTKNRITMNAVVMILIVSVLVLTNSKLIHAESIEILNLNMDPATVMVGDTFSINASILNNSTNTISVQNSCGGPFSILFDNHATVNMEKVCNWMPIQIILKPGENATLTSFASNLTYNASSPGTVNANVTLSYDIINQINPDLSNTDNIISKLLVFTIYDKNSQTKEEHLTILSPLKQFKSGIDAKDIQCKNGLELIIKVKNNFPACVKQNTVSKIVLLGWIKLMQDNLSEKDESSTRIITLEDDGKSISLNADQSFLLKLGEDFEWNIEIDNQTVVSRALNIMVVKGAQGVYESHSPGHATLTAVGDPPCLHSEPPCRMHSILFTLNIEVLQ